MSAALLKRSLAIVEEDMEVKKAKKDEKNKSKNQKYEPSDYSKSSFKQNSQKCTIDEIKQNLAKKSNLVEENIQRLLKLHAVKPKLDEETTKKILQRGRTKRYVLNVDEKKRKPEKSIFTEEDFQKFEKEYTL